jgi:DNA-binding transcriptional MerR regulator
MYTTGDVIQRLSPPGKPIARQTIANWCKEFAEHLSVTATPSEGSHRRFTDDDLTVFALVHTMKQMGNTYEEIHASLANGQRGQFPDLPNALTIAGGGAELVMLQARLSDAMDEIERLKPFETKAMVEEAMRREYQEQLRLANEKIAQLNREIGRLEGQE